MVSYSILFGYSFVAWGLASAGGWSLLNLWLLRELIPWMLQTERKPLLTILFLVSFKLLLYGGGLALLWSFPFSKVGVFIGFSVPLLFISLQALIQAGKMTGGVFRFGGSHG